MSSHRADAREAIEASRSRSRDGGDEDTSNGRLLETLHRLESRFDEALSKIKKKTDTYEFRYKGNKMQHRFNSNLLEMVEETLDLLAHGDLRKSEKKIKAVRNELEKRNKLLKIADRSAGGWGTVEEYLSDELADDSSDDRRITAAEERALSKKRKHAHSKKTYSSHTFSKAAVESTQAHHPGFPPSTRASVPVPQPPPPPPPPQTIVIQQPGPSAGRHYSQGAPQKKRRTDGPCFECGRYGHVRASCTQRRR